MRQHVNPLSRFFQLDNELPKANKLFDNCDLPIHLDIGCARGRFLLDMASATPMWNFLGLEIRESLVIASEMERIQFNINNLKFLFCNANVSLDAWLASFEKRKVEMVSIQFPDPWFKLRHRKRRVLNSSLVLSMARNLDEGSKLFIQTDILEVMEDMVQQIESSQFYDKALEDNFSFTMENPFPFCTEREIYVQKKGLPIYRQLYLRNSEIE